VIEQLLTQERVLALLNDKIFGIEDKKDMNSSLPDENSTEKLNNVDQMEELKEDNPIQE
jgi:hypothetical protein